MKATIQRSGDFLAGIILPTNGASVALGLKMEDLTTL
jgi:mannitol-specific phosphotransferase system IIBC component